MNLTEIKKALSPLVGQAYPSGKELDNRELSAKLHAAETGAAVADCIVPELERICKDKDQAFISGLFDILARTIDPTAWLVRGVLFNPERIPNEGPNDYIAIYGASGVITTQDVAKTVVYLGDVNLEISEGKAELAGQAKVYADSMSHVFAHGHAEVNATGNAQVSLFDYTRATAKDLSLVSAWDNSFVEAIGGEPKIWAYRQSQVLVSAGSVSLNIAECARGVVLSEGCPGYPVRVTLEGSGLVYAITSDPKRICITNCGLWEVILYGDRLQLSSDKMRDLIVPRYNHLDKVYEDPIKEPLPIGQLLVDLDPFLLELNEEDRQALRVADNEEVVCELITPYLTQLLDQGLTGDFLRSHFTEETLLDNGIYVRFNYEAWQSDNYRHEAYFFGDQLVIGSDYADKVYGYEQTFVIADRVTELHHQACGYVNGNKKMSGFGEGMVFAEGKAKVEAQDKLTIHLSGASNCLAKGDSLVFASDNAVVKGQERSRLVLLDRSMATTKDDCRAIVEGANIVKAKGRSSLWYGLYEQPEKPVIKVLSGKVNLIGVNTPEELAMNRAFLELYPTRVP
ncbi:MAG: hypothetical protein ACI3ZY_13325 [Parabacteroides sp.]